MKVRRFLLAMLLAGLVRFDIASAADEGAPTTLGALLEQVQAEQRRGTALNAAREARFRESRDTQLAEVKRARSELRRVEQRSDELRAVFERSETHLQSLREGLDAQAASLGELFHVVRESAADAAALLETSLVSAQYGVDRVATLRRIAEHRERASLAELETVWLTLLEEMAAGGQVVQFNTPVVTVDGSRRDRTVTRIGTFNAIADSSYLRYVPETGQLVELAGQPDRRYLALADSLAHATGGTPLFGLDPTRGVLLAALIRTPDIWERIQQGGPIAYVILALGAIAFAMMTERAAYLTREGRRVRAQLRDPAPHADNALGRVLRVYGAEQTADPQAMEPRLDELVLQQIPLLERGLATIAILATVAPLLGLLGTVVGMIDTFQAITLFGTGDARLMSGGIAQALVTTQLGLTVAIPILLGHTLLTNKSNRLVQILDEQSAGLIARQAEQRDSAQQR